MRFSIFSKILIVLLAIFLGLAYYAYETFQKEKEVIASSHQKVIVTVSKPMPHPTLSTKESNQSEALSLNENNDTNESNQSDEENETEEIISQEELENYPIAQTIPLEEEEIPEENVAPEVEEEMINEELFMKGGEDLF